MKTTSKVTRYVALGLSILYLVIVAISCVLTAIPLLIYLIPIVGWILLLYSIILFPIGLVILWGIAANTFALIASIKAVVNLAKNKHRISTGVLLAVAGVLTAFPACLVPFATAALTIVSAVFKKKAENKEAEANN